MDTGSDITPIVRSWLHIDEHESADRLLKGVLAQLDVTPQRRAVRPARGTRGIAISARSIIAIAAVIVVAVVAINWLPSTRLLGGPGAPASRSPDPTVDPSPDVTSTTRPLPATGDLDPGTYVITRPEAVIRVTLPDGWSSGDPFTFQEAGTVYKEATETTGWSSTSILTLGQDVASVRTEVCVGADEEAEYVAVGPTVEALTSALARQIANEPSEARRGATRVTVGGYPAMRFELTYPGLCPGPEGRLIWDNGAGQGAEILKDGITIIDVIDVDGARLVMTSLRRGTTTGEDEELDAIMASIRIDPRAAAAPPTSTTPTRLGDGKTAIDPGLDSLVLVNGPSTGRVTLTVPAGWWRAGPEIPDLGAIYKGDGRVSQPVLALAVDAVSEVVSSVCPADPTAPEVGPVLERVGPGVDDLTTAIGDVVGTRWSPPEDVMISGYPAKRLVSTFNMNDCQGPARRTIWESAQGWESGQGSFVEHGVTSTVYVVDADGHRLVLTSKDRGAAPDDVAELAVMIASIRIDPPSSTGPTTTPSPTGTAGGRFPIAIGPDSDLRVGRHAAIIDGVPFTFEVPRAGWEPQRQFYISKSNRGSQGAEATLRWTTFPDSSTTEWCSGVVGDDIGRSVVLLASAIAAAPGLDVVSGPSDVTVGGRSAKHVVLTVREDMGCDPGHFYTYDAVDGGAMWTATLPRDTIEVWIVDVDGTILFIEGETREDAGPAGDQLRQIVDSMRFTAD